LEPGDEVAVRKMNTVYAAVFLTDSWKGKLVDKYGHLSYSQKSGIALAALDLLSGQWFPMVCRASSVIGLSKDYEEAEEAAATKLRSDIKAQHEQDDVWNKNRLNLVAEFLSMNHDYCRVPEFLDDKKGKFTHDKAGLTANRVELSVSDFSFLMKLARQGVAANRNTDDDIEDEKGPLDYQRGFSKPQP
jgi:hypothetical protein